MSIRKFLGTVGLIVAMKILVLEQGQAQDFDTANLYNMSSELKLDEIDMSYWAEVTFIESAHFDEATGVLRLDIAYSGGCEEHDFAIDLLEDCFASQNSCAIQLTKTAGFTDYCRMLVSETLNFDLTYLPALTEKLRLAEIDLDHLTVRMRFDK